MKFRFTPRVTKVINILEKEGFFVARMKGDHIIINKHPPLKRPIVITNVKKPSNVVRLNLLQVCHDTGIQSEKIKEINKILK